MCRDMDASPYKGLAPAEWRAKTEELLADYPVSTDELAEIVLDQWASIFKSGIGRRGLRIGEHIFPTPQIMGQFLHELIPYELQARYPDQWRRDQTGADKDLVYVPDPDAWSTEIKTSSNARQVFGNRSYAQPSTSSRKTKSGFYLTVNFQRWVDVDSGLPGVRLIRLGWLDHTDWIPQKAQSGQQARNSQEAYAGKLLVIGD